MTASHQRLFHKTDEACASIDYSLTRLLLGPLEDLPVHQFVLTLLLAAEEGHLALKIGKEILPDLNALWDQTLGVGHGLTEEAIREGAKRCPKYLIADVEKEPPLKPICKEKECFYLQRLWKSEAMFKQNCLRLAKSLPDISLSQKEVEKHIQNLPLTDEQQKGVKASIQRGLSIISGGPGTGKTYTAGVLIQVLFESLSDEQKRTIRFVLAAPTGKAAKNLERSFQRVARSLKEAPSLKAKTLHDALGVKPNTLLDHPAFLPADIVIVDECSMIDVQMMAGLMASVRPGARLIMLGDSHQLPPVEAGSLFSDMMKLPGAACELTKCLRTESQGIIELSSQIYRGGDPLSKMNVPGICRLEFSLENDWQAQKEIAAWASRHYPSDPVPATAESLTRFIRSFCLLTPLRKGPLGVDQLNEKIMQCSSNKNLVPIMIIKKSRSLGLYNGDMGLLINDEKALFLSEEGKLREIAKPLLPPFEYAFCLSVHKSQGSEFDRVALLMPKGSEIFGREIFYTGVTRAKKQLDIWGSDDTLRAVCQKKTMRYSGVSFVDLFPSSSI